MSDANIQQAALPLERSQPTAAEGENKVQVVSTPPNPSSAVQSDLPNATEPLGVTLGAIPGPSVVEDVSQVRLFFLLVLLRARCRVNS